MSVTITGRSLDWTGAVAPGTVESTPLDVEFVNQSGTWVLVDEPGPVGAVDAVTGNWSVTLPDSTTQYPSSASWSLQLPNGVTFGGSLGSVPAGTYTQAQIRAYGWGLITDIEPIILRRPPAQFQVVTGPTGPPGPLSTWRGTWSSGTTYATNDEVFYAGDGSGYIAVASSTNVTPGTDASKWQKYVQAGAAGTTELTDPSKFTVADDFGGGTLTSGQIGAHGWSFGGGTVSIPAAVSGHPGIISLATGTTSGTVAALYLAADSSNPPILGSDAWDVTMWVRLDTLDTNTQLRIGMVTNPLGDPPTEGVWIKKDFGGSSFLGVVRTAGVTNTGVTIVATPAAGTWVKFRIRRIASSTAGFTVDAGTESTLSTATLSTLALLPVIQIKNQTTTSQILTADRIHAFITGLSR